MSKHLVFYFTGLKLIGDGLASLYKYKEEEQPTFSLLIVAKPPPVIAWKFGDDTEAGKAEMEVSNKDLFLYKYSYTLNPLQLEDCGKILSYTVKDEEGKNLYKSLTNKYQKAKIIVLCMQYLFISEIEYMERQKY